MMLHERLERVAKLADAMGQNFSTYDIRTFALQAEAQRIDWFRAIIPTGLLSIGSVSWGWGRQSRTIEVGPEF